MQIFKLFVLCKKETFSSDHLIATLACQGKVAKGQIFGKWNVLIQSGDFEPLNNLFNENRDLAKANVALHCVYESHLLVWSSTSKCSVLVKYHILDRYVVMEHFYFGEKLLFHFSAQNNIAITPRSANHNNHSETSIWQGFLYWNIEYKNKDNQNFFLKVLTLWKDQSAEIWANNLWRVVTLYRGKQWNVPVDYEGQKLFLQFHFSFRSLLNISSKELIKYNWNNAVHK